MCYPFAGHRYVAQSHLGRRAQQADKPKYFGVLLKGHTDAPRNPLFIVQGNGPEVCCVWDDKRGAEHGRYELPEGGAELERPRACGYVDTSPFATARNELWEEAGIWIGWRQRADYYWVDTKGKQLAGDPPWTTAAFLVTTFFDRDVITPHEDRKWLELHQCKPMLRQDHRHIVQNAWFDLRQRIYGHDLSTLETLNALFPDHDALERKEWLAARRLCELEWAGVR